MKSIKSIDIIGCGIVGLVTAITIKNLLPNSIINIYDAGAHPEDPAELIGTTFGKGRDARHFTGTESLSFQNPVHSRALRLGPGENTEWPGWRLIPESKLTLNEKRWRSECVRRFVELKKSINPYDDLHAQLNYAGMEAWNLLQKQMEYIREYQLSDGPVSVYFLTKNNFDEDLKIEKSFIDRFGESIIQMEVGTTEKNTAGFKSYDMHKKTLKLPGSSWRIRSMGLRILTDLEKRGVKFNWNKTISGSSNLGGDVVIWTVGTTHAIPDLYKKHSLIQGIAGCWVSIPNPGFKKPFKISLPQPSGYINCTPEDEIMHISGGFGWVGERPYPEAFNLMQPISDHFKLQINRYFGISVKKMDLEGEFPVSICIRPSSPTGLPDTRSISIKNRKNIILTGSGKSGSTQAALLALYAMSVVNPLIVDQYVKSPKIKNAISSLNSLSKIHQFGISVDYPEDLENDLFGVKK